MVTSYVPDSLTLNVLENSGDSEAVSFHCESHELFGIVHKSHIESSRAVVLVPGGGQYRVGAHRLYVKLARNLAESGVHVLRFDLRGIGDSEGVHQGFADSHADIESAVNFLHTRVKNIESIVLCGVCDGASASLNYAVGDDRIKGLCLINPWATTDFGAAKTVMKYHYFKQLGNQIFWKRFFTGKIDIWKSSRELYETVLRIFASKKLRSDSNIQTDKLISCLKAFRNPILFVISEKDLTALEFSDLIEGNGDLGVANPDTKLELCRISNADHTLTSNESQSTLFSVVRSWMNSQSAKLN